MSRNGLKPLVTVNAFKAMNVKNDQEWLLKKGKCTAILLKKCVNNFCDICVKGHLHLVKYNTDCVKINCFKCAIKNLHMGNFFYCDHFFNRFYKNSFY